MLHACMHIYMKGRQSPNMFLFGNCRKGTAEPKIGLNMFRTCFVCVHVACIRAREATALLGHMLARQQVCGRGGACNGDIYKICTYRLLYKYVVDGVSLRHNPGGVGCGQLLLGVALVVFSLSLFPFV